MKNRYVGRTFIMPDQRTREMSVRRKLNAMPAVFEGKNILLVDDSIVRGTTMSQIVEMVGRVVSWGLVCGPRLLLRHCAAVFPPLSAVAMPKMLPTVA